jgi:hypothetical protein
MGLFQTFGLVFLLIQNRKMQLFPCFVAFVVVTIARNLVFVFLQNNLVAVAIASIIASAFR